MEAGETTVRAVYVAFVYVFFNLRNFGFGFLAVSFFLFHLPPFYNESGLPTLNLFLVCVYLVRTPLDIGVRVRCAFGF